MSSSSIRAGSPRRAPPFLRALLLLLVCAAPPVALLAKGSPRLMDGLLLHLAATVLPTQLLTSLAAALGAVVAGALLASGGVLCGLFRFPGRRLLSRLSLAPLLLPAWYLAVLYQERLGISGVPALIFVLSLSSAPLFQLLMTASLRSTPSRYHDVLLHLGRGRPAEVARHLLPLTLPAMAAASVLVFFLAWADEAAARTLAAPTLTVGLYDQWFGRQDDAAGAPLALLLLLLSLAPAWALWARLTRGSFRPTARLQGRSLERVPLEGPAALVPWLAGAPLLLAGVIYPSGVILSWTWARIGWVDLATLGGDLIDSLILAVGGTALGLLLALALLQQRVAAKAPGLTAITAGLALTTFAVPPLVLALAFLWLLPERGGWTWTVWLNGTPLPLIAALGLRFCAVFLVTGQAALLRVASAHRDLIQVLGRTDLVSFVSLFRPFIAGPLTAIAGLALLATLQDLSLSLVLQPFGFTTISSRVFGFAQSHRVPDCAVWMLCQALVGVYPLSLMARWAESAGGK